MTARIRYVRAMFKPWCYCCHILLELCAVDVTRDVTFCLCHDDVDIISCLCHDGMISCCGHVVIGILEIMVSLIWHHIHTMIPLIYCRACSGALRFYAIVPNDSGSSSPTSRHKSRPKPVLKGTIWVTRVVGSARAISRGLLLAAIRVRGSRSPPL